jgi:hypothetical protein
MKKSMVVLIGLFVLAITSNLAADDSVDVRKVSGFLQAHEKGLIIEGITAVDNSIILHNVQDDSAGQCFNPRYVTFKFEEDENGEKFIVIQTGGRHTTREQAERDQLKFRVHFTKPEK